MWADSTSSFGAKKQEKFLKLMGVKNAKDVVKHSSKDEGAEEKYKEMQEKLEDDFNRAINYKRGSKKAEYSSK